MLKKLFLVLFSIFLANFALAEESISSGVITRLERCETAKANRAKLADLSKPIYIREDNGKVRELSYAEILSQRDEQDKIIKETCSPLSRGQVKKMSFTAGSNYINKAKAAQITDTVWLALLHAIQEQNIAEVYTIMRYVMGIDETTVSRFSALVEDNPEQAEAVYNAKRKKNDPSGKWDLSMVGGVSPNPDPDDDKKKDSDFNKPPPQPNKIRVETESGETLTFYSNPKHTRGNSGYNPYKVGTEPQNSLELFRKSVQFPGDKARYTVDEYGHVHQFHNTHGDTYHWSGSTGDKTCTLKHGEIQSLLRPLRQMGAKL